MTSKPEKELESKPRVLGGWLRSLMDGIPWSESAEGEQVYHLDAPAEKLVHIHNANGRTEVVGEEREDIEILACKQARAECDRAAEDLVSDMTVTGEIFNGVLEIEVETPRKWNRHGRVGLKVRMPRNLHLSVTSANGRVAVDGMRAPVHVRTSNGSVCVHDVEGDVKVSADNAKIRCQKTCGRLRARSSCGKVELSDHTGSIDATTSNGSIRASVDSVVGEGVRLATSNGRIVLELPEEVDAEMDIRVDNGVIRNDHELCSTSADSVGRLRGRLGRGGPLIRLRTSNGTVSVR